MTRRAPAPSASLLSPIHWWAEEDLWFGGHRWFGLKDLALALTLVLRLTRQPALLEIWLWRGSWPIHLAKSLGLTEVSNMDPYLGVADVRNGTIAAYGRQGAKLSLYPAWDDFPDLSFNVVLVDGEHSEVADLRDLVGSSS